MRADRVCRHAQTLPTAKPETWDSRPSVRPHPARLRAARRRGSSPAPSYSSRARATIAMFEASGVRDTADDRRRIDPRHALHASTLSKPLTSVGLMLLFEEGKVHAREPVSGRYIPRSATSKVVLVEKVEPGAGRQRRSSWCHVAARHVDPGPAAPHLRARRTGSSETASSRSTSPRIRRRLSDECRDGRAARKLPLAYQPGTTWDYSYSTNVLGRLIEGHPPSPTVALPVPEGAPARSARA